MHGNEDEDEYDSRIKRSGCYEQHMKLLDCHFETKDWRACKDAMREFKECFERHEQEAASNELPGNSSKSTRKV
ncbi:hypothetical protein BJ742DRAFT_675641 [Cladochytrium replicatum]|nr:hypothetical protein BJ742DRAFT_675641 [Cladochytrium replicatum]